MQLLVVQVKTGVCCQCYTCHQLYTCSTCRESDRGAGSTSFTRQPLSGNKHADMELLFINCELSCKTILFYTGKSEGSQN